MIELAIVGRQGNPWIDPWIGYPADCTATFQLSPTISPVLFIHVSIPSSATGGRLAGIDPTLTSAQTVGRRCNKRKHATLFFLPYILVS